MRTEKITIWEQGEYDYPMAFGFEPNLRTYLHEDETVRPCMLVVPGGGYCIVSPTEGEIVAKKFYEKGYNAFVLTYTTNLLMAAPLKKQPIPRPAFCGRQQQMNWCRWRTAICLQRRAKKMAYHLLTMYFLEDSMDCRWQMRIGRWDGTESHTPWSRPSALCRW